VTPITISIVEDNSAVLASLQRVLTQTEDCRCVSISRNGDHALRTVPRHLPDLVIMDINLPDISGIECTARLKRLHPQLQVLIFTVYNDSREIFKALEAGASGYLLKRSTAEEILQAVRDVKSGGAPMSAEIARKVVQSFHRPTAARTENAKALTARETEILGLLAQGLATKDIAAKMGVNYTTVCTHLGNIYAKLHVRSRTAAVIKYLQGTDRGGRVETASE
jgi:DNA-binding NarL/FixJ family response regulator